MASASDELSARDRLEILDLLAAHAHDLDSGQSARWHSCFADDAELTTARGPVRGVAEIVGYLREQMAGFSHARHLLFLPSIAPAGTGRAEVVSYFQLSAVTVDGKPVSAQGRYDDVVVRGADGWRIASRRAQFDDWFTDRPVARTGKG